MEDWKEACDLCIKLIHNGGVGHSISIHTEDRDMVLKFATKPVFRILVNSPSSQGGVGASTALAPSFTLGSGTWGGSSTSDNVTPLHLINIKRIAYGIKDVTSSQPVIGSSDSLSKVGKTGSITEEQVTAIVGEVLKRMTNQGGLNG